MKSIETRIVISAIIIVLVVVTGIILSKKGKPYNTAITTVHKLLSLTAIVLCATIVYHQYKLVGLSSMDSILVLVSAIFFLFALVSGGLLTVEKPMSSFVTILHKLSSGLSIGFCAFVIYRFY